MMHIFYRHYNVSGRESWRPEWFDYENCWTNIYNQVKNNSDISLNLVFDGDNENNFIFKYNFDRIFKISAGNDWVSFTNTLSIVKSLESDIQKNDVIYLLENDYLHVPNWYKHVFEFFESNLKNNYLSLYDHNDKYFTYDEGSNSKIYVTNTHHYRTTLSTCGSYLVTKSTFDEDYDFNNSVVGFLKNKTNLPLDHAKFLILQQIKNRKLFTPIPGLSTHCLNNLMSPTINWEKISNE